MVLEMLKDRVEMSATTVFTEIEISLLSEVGKTNKRGDIKAMMIRGVALDLGGIDKIVDTDWISFQITSKEANAELEMDDKDCIFKFKVRWDGTPLEGQAKIHYFWFPGDGVPYLKKRIWIAVDDAGSAAAVDYPFIIYYDYKYLNSQLQTRIISQLQ